MEAWAKIAKFIDEGGTINYVILGILALATAIALERIWFFFIRCRLDSKQLMAEITSLVRKNNPAEARKLCSKTQTPLGFILEAGIWQFEHDSSEKDIEDSMQEVSLREIPKLQKRTNYLGLFANLCTLFGLLGTIFGLQAAFLALDAADPSQKSKLMAQGIATAMNTTALGLMAAIPCMIAHSFLGNKANSLLEQIEESGLRLVNFLSVQTKNQKTENFYE